MIDVTVSAIRRQIVRRANPTIVGGFRPPDDPFTSWFGKVNMALPEED